jgi:hypothetical protein
VDQRAAQEWVVTKVIRVSQDILEIRMAKVNVVQKVV